MCKFCADNIAYNFYLYTFISKNVLYTIMLSNEVSIF